MRVVDPLPLVQPIFIAGPVTLDVERKFFWNKPKLNKCEPGIYTYRKYNINLIYLYIYLGI